MSLSSENFKTVFTCTGGTTYDFDFKVFEEGDLEVIRITTAGVESTLVITTNYSVSLLTDYGGRITTVSTYTDGQIVARRKLALLQEADWERNGDFSTDVLEEQLDKQIMMIQQLQEQVDRSIFQASSETTTLTFPAPVADKIIGWNTAGTALENKVAVDDDVAAAALASQVAAAASAVAAAASAAEAEAIGGFDVDVDPTLAADSDVKIASQKATKAFVEGKTGFKTLASKSAGVDYLAATDGLVQANAGKNSGTAWLMGYTDATATPTTNIFYCRASDSVIAAVGFTMLVNKGEYWRVELPSGDWVNIAWLPLGN